MTYLEIDKALSAIVFCKCEECEKKLKTTPKEAKTERKALQIQIGMYRLFYRAAIEHFPKVTGVALTKRLAEITKWIPHYPHLYAAYQNADTAEKEHLLFAVHAELYMRQAFLKPAISELVFAQANSDVDRSFELDLKVKSMLEILNLCENWRAVNDVYPGLFGAEPLVPDSAFYKIAYMLLQAEVERLEHICEDFDVSPSVKEEHIAQYKCIKYRYASVLPLFEMLCHCNYHRKQHNLAATHYLLPPIDDLLKNNTNYLSAYDGANVADKPDYGLFYGMLSLVDKLVSEVQNKRKQADDWEAIELKERMDGLLFVRSCLERAWKQREG